MCFGLHCTFETNRGECRKGGHGSCPHEIYNILEYRREEWRKNAMIALNIEYGQHIHDFEPIDDLTIEELEYEYGFRCEIPNPDDLDDYELSEISKKEASSMFI